MDRDKEGPVHEMAMRWLLNFSDGEHSLLDIAERSVQRFSVIKGAASRLEQAGLLIECEAR